MKEGIRPEDLLQAVQVYATDSAGFTRSKVCFSDNWFQSQRWQAYLEKQAEDREKAANPTGAGKARTKEPLTETFVFRCTAAEKAQLRAKAEAAGLPAATLLREALGLTEARRRKRIPRVDPALVLAVGRIGGNLLIKFFRNGKGAGAGPVGYLVADKVRGWTRRNMTCFGSDIPMKTA